MANEIDWSQFKPDTPAPAADLAGFVPDPEPEAPGLLRQKCVQVNKRAAHFFCQQLAHRGFAAARHSHQNDILLLFREL